MGVQKPQWTIGYPILSVKKAPVFEDSEEVLESIPVPQPRARPKRNSKQMIESYLGKSDTIAEQPTGKTVEAEVYPEPEHSEPETIPEVVLETSSEVNKSPELPEEIPEETPELPEETSGPPEEIPELPDEITEEVVQENLDNLSQTGQSEDVISEKVESLAEQVSLADEGKSDQIESNPGSIVEEVASLAESVKTGISNQTNTSMRFTVWVSKK